jgi:glutamate synthase (NADPH/NADH) small chain
MQNGKLLEIANSEFVVECDAVIKATGQSKHTELFALMGIKLNAKNCIEVSAHLQCSRPNYFAAGDAVSGGQEVVNAAADGKKAAQQMYNYLLKNN